MKKVLIFSHNPMSEISNNGKTIESLFSKYTSSKICQLYIDKTEPPSFNLCNNYFLLSDKDILKNVFSFNKYYDVGEIVTNLENKTDEKKSRNIPKIFKNNLFKILRNIVWDYATWHSIKLQNWITEQSPDVLFFVGGNYTFSHKIACRISSFYKLPLITFFTDDYILNNKSFSFFDIIYKPFLIRQYKNTVKKSVNCYAIGKLMSEKYSTYFNKQFEYLMNCVDIIPFQLPEKTDSIVISYFGGLHLNRWKSLILFADELSKREIRKSYIIQVYSFTTLPKKIKKKLISSKIEIKDPVRGETLRNAISSSHFLLHLESYDNKYIELTRYSISTKIPEYLISSRMLIGFGPSELASMKLLSENNIGIVLDEKTEKYEENMNRLISYIMNFNNTHDIIEKGYKYAVNNYSKHITSTILYSAIEKL